jgi:uncharacterized protein YndB with AHSA1/START domain
MAQYVITREYPYPIQEVWAAVTDPELVAQWTTTGQGGRPDGFVPIAGTQFRFLARPTIGWAGIVYCEVISVDAPHAMHYTWKGEQESHEFSDVRYLLEETSGGTRFTWSHTGFTGVQGFAMSRLLGSVRRKMLTDGLPPVLEAHHWTAAP